MPASVLATKLYLPPIRPNAVSRPCLVERLNESLHCKLTLISAPAGFGKTTLVSEWVAGCQRPIAWCFTSMARPVQGLSTLQRKACSTRWAFDLSPSTGRDMVSPIFSLIAVWLIGPGMSATLPTTWESASSTWKDIPPEGRMLWRVLTSFPKGFSRVRYTAALRP